MKRLDIRDWFVMVLLAGLASVGSIYVFNFHSDTAFGIWAGVVGTLTAAIHWINVGDDKKKDDHE